ncbi:hypothetical protein QYM36_012766 [Artemia franciscana]|uniref:Uncharacterized protein n=1 Tax=Artemia franciscana TaxID=6661 RepID=A0AA88HK02_ARTSF|nr:hypothetical protein QYM36_012766 [Artemia franciscana]
MTLVSSGVLIDHMIQMKAERLTTNDIEYQTENCIMSDISSWFFKTFERDTVPSRRKEKENNEAKYFKSHIFDMKTSNITGPVPTWPLEEKEPETVSPAQEPGFWVRSSLERDTIQSKRQEADTGELTNFKFLLDFKVTNVMSSFFLGCRVKPRHLVKNTLNSELDAKRETQKSVWCKISLRRPNIKARVYHTGRVTVTGTDESNVRIGGRKIARLIQKLGYPAKFLQHKFHNFVGNAKVGYRVKIGPLFEQLTKNPAIILGSQQEGRPSLIIQFVDSTGTCVLDDLENLKFTARSREGIKDTALRMISILEQYYKQNGMEKTFKKEMSPNNKQNKNCLGSKKQIETGTKREEVFNKRKRNNEANIVDNWITRNRSWLYPQKSNSQKKSNPDRKQRKVKRK